jgi:hypothetical protein
VDSNVCPNCAEPMDSHSCPGSGTTVVRKKRKAPGEHPTCPHCGGRVHWNNGASLVNFDCMYRQYLMASGEIHDPSARLPVLTAAKLTEMADWIDEQVEAAEKGGAVFEYGTITGAGGASTYSMRRAAETAKEPKPKKERKKRQAALPPAEMELAAPSHPVGPPLRPRFSEPINLSGLDPFTVNNVSATETAVVIPPPEVPVDTTNEEERRRAERRKKLARFN